MQMMTRYILDHWRGAQGIGRAFWINLVALRCLLLAAEQLFQPPFIGHIADALAPALVYYAVSLGVVLPCQVVGVIRATDRMAPQLGSSAQVLLAQIGVVVMLLPTGVTAFQVFQPLMEERPAEPAWVMWERERASKYRIELDRGGLRLKVTGEFELGLAKSLAAALARNPGVKEIVLDSDGGFVNQGRAVARLIEQRGLDTRVVGRCKSACAIAFMGGVRRRIHRLGLIGFHQYRFDARTHHPAFDVAEEQRRDSAYLLTRGVSAPFVARAFTAGHSAIWAPAVDELLAAGVVTEITGDSNRYMDAVPPQQA
jgi:hypothetical protein